MNCRKRDYIFSTGALVATRCQTLQPRWEKDMLDLKPDVLSILIGINDTSAFVFGDKNLTAEQYETGYRTLLKQTKEQLPNIQFVLCEPFILKVGGRVR